VSGLVVRVVLGWFVDPGGCRELGWFGVPADEPFGVAGVGGGQDVSADRVDGRGVSMVDVVRGVPGDAGMSVFGVVPTEEALAEGSGVFDAAEGVGEVRPVLQPESTDQVLICVDSITLIDVL
jgi:hypothetical protein